MPLRIIPLSCMRCHRRPFVGRAKSFFMDKLIGSLACCGSLFLRMGLCNRQRLAAFTVLVHRIFCSPITLSGLGTYGNSTNQSKPASPLFFSPNFPEWHFQRSTCFRWSYKFRCFSLKSRKFSRHPVIFIQCSTRSKMASS